MLAWQGKEGVGQEPQLATRALSALVLAIGDGIAGMLDESPRIYIFWSEDIVDLRYVYSTLTLEVDDAHGAI